MTADASVTALRRLVRRRPTIVEVIGLALVALVLVWLVINLGAAKHATGMQGLCIRLCLNTPEKKANRVHPGSQAAHIVNAGIVDVSLGIASKIFNSSIL